MRKVRCDTLALELNVIAGATTLAMHSGSYFKIGDSTLGVTLKGNLNPYADLEGRPAKVE